MIRAGKDAAQAKLERDLIEAHKQDEKVFAKKGPQEKTEIQKYATRVAESSAFTNISIIMIAAFSILLAFAEPNEPPDSPRNTKIKRAENAFTILFTVELSITWVAAGLIQFFHEGWNVFDLVVIGIGWFAFTDIGEGFPLACIRVARLLRPLRTLNRIEGLKRLVDCLVASLPGIANVGGMIVSFIFIMSLFGLKMFIGLMRYGCVDVEQVLHYDEAASLEMPCDGCAEYGLVCAEVGNPNYGFSSFDSLPAAALAVFQVVTLEGWTELMDVLLDVSMDALVGVYFGMIVCVGAFFLTNYLLAQVCLIFTSKLKVAKALKEKQKAKERKLAKLLAAFGGDKKRKKVKQPKLTIELVQARGLRRMDLVSSDPYVLVQCGAVAHRSRTIRHSLEPKWTETVQFAIEADSEESQLVTIEVFDEDFASRDQAMGTVDIEVQDYTQAKIIEKNVERQTIGMAVDPESISVNGEATQVWDEWYRLKPMVGCQNPMGEIRLKISWNLDDIEQMSKRNDGPWHKEWAALSPTEKRAAEDLDEGPLTWPNWGREWPGWLDLTKTQRLAAVTLGKTELDWPPEKDAVSKCETFIESKSLERFINLCVIVNFILLAVDYHGMPEAAANAIELVNIILTWIFTIELLIKLPVLGLTKFSQEPFNLLDAFVVVSSQCELWLAWISGGDGGALSGLRTFRLLRILRSLKLINQNKSLRDMMKTTVGSITAIRDFGILLVLMLYIYALTGLTMFGGKIHTEDGGVPRTNFDDLLWSFATVFIVMTRENWQAVLFEGMNSAGSASCIYFISLVILTNYILLALFIGTLLENFEKFFLQGAVEDEEKERATHQKLLDDLLAGLSPTSSVDSSMDSLKDSVEGDTNSSGREVGKMLLNAVPAAKMFSDRQHLSEEEKLAFILKVPLLAKLPPAVRPILCKVLLPVVFAGGDVIMRCGEKTDQESGMFFIVSGSANVKVESGKTVKNIAAGDYVGELALSQPGGIRSATVTVRERSMMLKLQRKHYLTVMACDPNAALILKAGSQEYTEIRPRFNSKCRTQAQDLVYHNVFEVSVLVAIMLSSGALAIEHPNDDPESTTIKVLKVLDIVFIIFFTFEMVIKMVAMGFWGGGGDLGDGYFRSGWNWLDFVIVVSALAVLISGAEGGVFRAIRAVRILRPLRAIQRSKGMRTTVAALLGSVPAIATVAGCILFFSSIVAIMCVQLFKGTMFSCGAGEDWNSAFKSWEQHIWVKTACIGSSVVDGEMTLPAWESADQNFDNFFNSMLSLFEIFCLEAWPDILMSMVDATDVNHGPSKNNQTWVVFLVIALMMIGSFFLLNLFVGVIVTAYNEAQKTELVQNPDDEEISHVDALQLVMEYKPTRVFKTDNYLKKKLVLFTRQPRFEIAIMACILLNVFVMCVDWEGIDDDIVAVTSVLNSIFMWIFTAECALKLVALDYHYFYDGWNVFDFIVVVASLVESLSAFDFNPTLVRIFRVFRLARLLKLTRKAKGVQTLVKTFEATLPSLIHVGLLLLIFFFMYAVLGVQLFCNVKHGEAITRHADFSSFGASLFTLFRLSTGENWNIVMHELMIQPPQCTPEGDASDGISDCGSPLAAWIYLLSFTIVCAMTTLNLIIAVVLYAFFDMSEESLLEGEEVMKLRREHFDDFVDVWTSVDPEGAGQIVADSENSELLAQVVNQLPKPLGVDSLDEATKVSLDILEQSKEARKSRMPTENMPMIRAVWQQVDLDQDGVLGRPEVLDMLSKIKYKGGGGVTHNELDEVMKALDQDGDGEITFDEFADWYLRQQKPTVTFTEVLRHLVIEYSRDSDPVIRAALALQRIWRKKKSSELDRNKTIGEGIEQRWKQKWPHMHFIVHVRENYFYSRLPKQLKDEVEAGGRDGKPRPMISELRVNEIVAVTEIPDDSASGWLGGFRVQHPEQSGWFPANKVSKEPVVAAVKGKLSKMLPEPGDCVSMGAEAQPHGQGQRLNKQQNEEANDVPEGNSDSEEARAAADKQRESSDGTNEGGNGSTPLVVRRTDNGDDDSADGSWRVTVTPHTKARADQSAGSAMLASAAARRRKRSAPAKPEEDVSPATPSSSDARP